MSGVNAAAVAVLYRVDIHTLKAALDQKDLGLVRMTSGKVPTTGELELIKECGPEEFQAVNDLHRQNVDHSEYLAGLSRRGLELLLEYDTGGLTVEQIRPLMSEAHRAEFDAIAEVAFATGGDPR